MMKTTVEPEMQISEFEIARPERERGRRLLVAAICVAVSLVAAVPFFFMGQAYNDSHSILRMPATHDMFLHFDQMRSFYAGLASGEAYPRWEEETNFNFGAPTPSYYPPGVYYLTSVFFALTKDWIWTLLWSHLFMALASAAAMYIYARRVMSRGPALIAMCAYALLPYHIIDQYQRGAIAELLGFTWMPLVLFFADRLMSRNIGHKGWAASRLANIAGLAASYGAFVWSHPPTAYQFSLGLGVYLILKTLIEREWKGLFRTGAGIALGLAFAAAYILPAFIHQNLIRHEYVSGSWPYRQSYVFSQDQFNGEVFREFFKLLDAVWIHGVIAIVAAIIVFLNFKPRAISEASALKGQALLWVALGAFASFMMTSASDPIGRLIPKIDIGIFAWRMLSITTLVVALLAGAGAQVAINLRKQQRRSEMILIGSIAAFIIVTGIVISIISGAGTALKAPAFWPEELHINPAMVPSTVSIGLDELPADAPQSELEMDGGEVIVERWEPEHRVIRVELQQDDILLIRTFNFPGWSATVDSQPVEITTGEEVGNIAIQLQAGRHVVNLDYVGTTLMRRAGAITISSVFVLLALACSPAIKRLVRSRSDQQKRIVNQNRER